MQKFDIKDAHDVMAQIAKGDSTRFSELSTFSIPIIFYAIKGMVSDKSIVDDLTQNILLKIWRSAKTFDPDKSNYVTWLMIISKRCCIQYFRRKRIITSSIPEIQVEHPENNEETRTAIRKIVTKLPEQHQDFIRLRYSNSLSLKDIGESYKIPEGTIHSRLVRIRKSLKHQLMELELI